MKCARCSTELNSEARFCHVCGGPVTDGPGTAQPSAWIKHEDAWNGFAISHPTGWSVSVSNGAIIVSENAVSYTRAFIWPIRLASAQDARTVATQYVQWRRQSDAGVRAFEAPGSDPRRSRLRLTSSPGGQPLEELIEAQADGTSAMISGYQVPANLVKSRVETLGKILASFEPRSGTTRTRWTDPSEGAFSVVLPQGWGAQGGVRRDNAYGMAVTSFEAWGDSNGSSKVVMSSAVYQFTDSGSGGAGGWLGAMMGGGWMAQMMNAAGMQSLPYQNASDLLRSYFVPGWQRQYPDIRVESAVERPDLAQGLIQAAVQSGVGMSGAKASTALALVTYTDRGAAYLQRLRINTAFMPVLAWPGTPQPWMAELPYLYRAPRDQFAQLEATMQGIVDSIQVNPAWEQRENAMRQNQLLASQQDRMRRQQDISRTLSETSDIITSGYWQRQQVHDRLSHNWSNAILGYEDRLSPSGEMYNVPTGYDRVWRDAQGNFYGGGWLVNPDPTWTELKPTGH